MKGPTSRWRKKLDSGEKTSSDRFTGEPKCCVGITYFSQALHEHGKLPVSNDFLANRGLMVSTGHSFTGTRFLRTD